MVNTQLVFTVEPGAVRAQCGNCSRGIQKIPGDVEPEAVPRFFDDVYKWIDKYKKHNTSDGRKIESKNLFPVAIAPDGTMGLKGGELLALVAKRHR